MDKISEFKYSDNIVPSGYVCGDCGITGVRLYRRYQTFLDSQSLRCTHCAILDQKTQPTQNDSSIGWLVAAVPTEDGDTFWGFTSVPEDGVKWWYQLPIIIGE